MVNTVGNGDIMSKSDEVKKEVASLEKRVRILEESSRRLSIFDGMNDGSFLTDTNKRIVLSKKRLSVFIEKNLEYVI